MGGFQNIVFSNNNIMIVINKEFVLLPFIFFILLRFTRHLFTLRSKVGYGELSWPFTLQFALIIILHGRLYNWYKTPHQCKISMSNKGLVQ